MAMMMIPFVLSREQTQMTIVIANPIVPGFYLQHECANKTNRTVNNPMSMLAAKTLGYQNGHK